MRRWFLILLLVACSLAAAGCIKAEETVTIKEDGSSTMVTRMVGNVFAAEALKSSKDAFVKENPDAVAKEVQDGDMTGYEIAVSYPDIETLAAKGGDMFTAVEGRNAGAAVAKSWFYDTYIFDLFVAGEKMDTGAQDPESQAMVQGMLAEVQYNFTLNLPVKPETQNADSVAGDGKSLTWNLKTTITEGKDAKIQARYRIYNQTHIAMTVGGIVLILLIAGGFLYMRRRKQNDETA
ncbi:transmembrane domain-containing protein [Mitsuokella sp. AF33-22]|uniref:EGFR-like transmembrane domain-containing protein n=1 Tax=Mitsuokella sp. AF33-22 TaxID=2292047 RepID=UPI0011C434F3|nr:transmembrane domain-containing protein [Mitsuokella sp. AF33-22]